MKKKLESAPVVFVEVEEGKREELPRRQQSWPFLPFVSLFAISQIAKLKDKRSRCLLESRAKINSSYGRCSDKAKNVLKI